MPALQGLSISGANVLQDMMVPTLKTLRIDATGNHQIDIEAIAGLDSLRKLHISLKPFFAEDTTVDLAPLRGLKRLHTLRIDRANNYTLRGLEQLPALQTLHLDGFTDLSLTDLSALSRLRTLTLRDCKGMTDIRALASLTGLQKLTLTDCSRFDPDKCTENTTYLDDEELRSPAVTQAYLARL